MEAKNHSVYKKIAMFFSFMAWATCTASVYAQPALGTTSFASASTISLLTSAPCTAGRSSVSLGYRFTLYSGANCAMSNVAAGGTSDGHITLVTTPVSTGVWQEARIASSDGSEFSLSNFIFAALTTPFLGKTISVTGYRDGSPVAGATATSSAIAATGVANTITINVSSNSSFSNIDEFRLIPSAPSSAQGTISIMSITISAPLPIELISFEGKRINDETILLEWQTASETNNKEFEIQQSTDAINFTTVAYVQGKGNSISLSNYHLSVTNSKAFHYRLKQVDLDGTASYSRIIYLDGVSREITLLPNPIKDKISLSGDMKSNYQIYISDILCNSKEYYSGNLSQIESALNASLLKFPVGIYLLKAESDGEWQVLRFIKVD